MGNTPDPIAPSRQHTPGLPSRSSASRPAGADLGPPRHPQSPQSVSLPGLLNPSSFIQTHPSCPPGHPHRAQCGGGAGGRPVVLSLWLGFLSEKKDNSHTCTWTGLERTEHTFSDRRLAHPMHHASVNHHFSEPHILSGRGRKALNFSFREKVGRASCTQ